MRSLLQHSYEFLSETLLGEAVTVLTGRVGHAPSMPGRSPAYR
jgi:hypothetical protein